MFSSIGGPNPPTISPPFSSLGRRRWPAGRSFGVVGGGDVQEIAGSGACGKENAGSGAGERMEEELEDGEGGSRCGKAKTG